MKSNEPEQKNWDVCLECQGQHGKPCSNCFIHVTHYGVTRKLSTADSEVERMQPMEHANVESLARVWALIQKVENPQCCQICGSDNCEGEHLYWCSTCHNGFIEKHPVFCPECGSPFIYLDQCEDCGAVPMGGNPNGCSSCYEVAQNTFG